MAVPVIASGGVTTPDDVRKAYAIAVEEGSSVLVERSIQGIEHRLLVIGDKLLELVSDWLREREC